MYPTNGQQQPAPTFNGQGQIPYTAAPAGAPSAPPVAPVQTPQMGQQYVPAQPAQPSVPTTQIGGGYSGPPVQQYGFGATPAPPQVPVQQPPNPYAAYPQQPQQLPPQLPGQQPPAAPQGAPTQPPADLAEAIRAQGFQDPNQLIARLPQLQALAQYGAQALATQGQPQQPAQTQQPPAGAQQPEWAPPPYDPNWERFLDVDENTGRFVAADPALMHYANQANAHRDWLRGKSNEFWRNPYEFMASGLKPRIESELVKPLQEKISRLEQYIEQQQLWDGIAPYEHLLYTQGPQGLNYQQPSAFGQVFNSAYQASAGFTNNGQPLSVEQRIRFALGQAQSQQIQQQQYQPAPPPAQYQQPYPQQPQYQPAPPPQQQQQWQPTAPAINPAAAAQLQQQYAGQQSQQDSFLNRAIERAQQAPPTPYQFMPGQQGSLVTSAELGIAQSPTNSFEALAHQTARELGINL